MTKPMHWAVCVWVIYCPCPDLLDEGGERGKFSETILALREDQICELLLSPSPMQASTCLPHITLGRPCKVQEWVGKQEMEIAYYLLLSLVRPLSSSLVSRCQRSCAYSIIRNSSSYGENFSGHELHIKNSNALFNSCNEKIYRRALILNRNPALIEAYGNRIVSPIMTLKLIC